MSGHAKLSPSSSDRWLNCPGSIAAIAALPEGDDSNVYADEGTFAHEIAERALRASHGRGVPPLAALRDLLGEVSECGRFTADQEMIDHLEEYAVFCAGLIDKADEVGIESRVKAIPGKVYGTADFMAVVGNVLHVIDLKYGAGIPVSPVGNTQAYCYALGALNRIATTDDKLFEGIDTVEIRIFQPRNAKGGGVETLTVADLAAWELGTLTPGVKATEDPDAPRVVGDHCKFCPVRATCPALREAALEGAKQVFADPGEMVLEDDPADPSDLTLDQLSKALKAIPLVEQWIKAVHAHAYELANGGTAIEGFKLVRKTGYRKWTDEKKAEEALALLLPEGVSTHAEPKLLSPAQAEKKLGKTLKGVVGKLITKPDAGTALVPESDKRPAFAPGDVFKKDS